MKCFSVQNARKTAFFFFLFWVFSFLSVVLIYFFVSPSCTHSKLLYEVMFLIKICSGNFNHSPSRCTIASVTEVWEAGQPGSAEVMTKAKQDNFEPRGHL